MAWRGSPLRRTVPDRMRLAPRLVLAFGFVATLSVAGLGYRMREDRRESETRRFEQEVSSACERVVAEIGRQGESDRKLIAGACQSGELVDRWAIWLEAGTLDDGRRLSLSSIVPLERQAFDLDELVLATRDGDVLRQDPMPLLHARPEDVAKLFGGNTDYFSIRTGQEPALVSRCLSKSRAVGLAGARHLLPMIARLANIVDAKVTLGAPPADDDAAQATCTLRDAFGASLPVAVSKPKKELVENLARIDHTVLYAGLASMGVALVLAVLLARNLGRPIAELAAEARKVAAGEARPLRVRGAGEIAELAQAFDDMLKDLEATRRRLAAATRVAAWREVARQVAHEVKNPLAPIRAAVETLRRLRARQDPEFDAYFDEATRTVLDEVHRIANIVTEFTRFARLPAPKPQEIDAMELVRQVVRLHQASARVKIAVIIDRVPPLLRADRDQIVQVLTNLVQNALEAVVEKGDAGAVSVVLGTEGASNVAITVTDNGRGVAPEMAPRLFEPYATNKPQGTGLGLAIAQRIAVEHNGELAFVGRPGEGASFRLVLPVDGPPPASTEGAPSSR
jgi:two-component system, NtrC family, nitrogen regulation sensor histidine kinase NtrY